MLGSGVMTEPLIASFMTPHPHTIRCEQDVETAHRLMRQYGIRHLPVMDGETVVGVVSQRDLRLFAGPDGEDPRTVTVGEVMTREIATVSPEMPLAAAARQMASSRAGSVLVARAGHLIGIFTTTDALLALGRLLESGHLDAVAGREVAAMTTRTR